MHEYDWFYVSSSPSNSMSPQWDAQAQLASVLPPPFFKKSFLGSTERSVSSNSDLWWHDCACRTRDRKDQPCMSWQLLCRKAREALSQDHTLADLNLDKAGLDLLASKFGLLQRVSTSLSACVSQVLLCRHEFGTG
jgi:hypothetical protein